MDLFDGTFVDILIDEFEQATGKQQENLVVRLSYTALTSESNLLVVLQFIICYQLPVQTSCRGTFYLAYSNLSPSGLQLAAVSSLAHLLLLFNVLSKTKIILSAFLESSRTVVSQVIIYHRSEKMLTSIQQKFRRLTSRLFGNFSNNMF